MLKPDPGSVLFWKNLGYPSHSITSPSFLLLPINPFLPTLKRKMPLLLTHFHSFLVLSTLSYMPDINIPFIFPFHSISLHSSQFLSISSIPFLYVLFHSFRFLPTPTRQYQFFPFYSIPFHLSLIHI